MRRPRDGAPLGGRSPVMSLSHLCLHDNPGVLTCRQTEPLGLPGVQGLRQEGSGQDKGPNADPVERADGEQQGLGVDNRVRQQVRGYLCWWVIVLREWRWVERWALLEPWRTGPSREILRKWLKAGGQAHGQRRRESSCWAVYWELYFWVLGWLNYIHIVYFSPRNTHR